MTDKHPKFKKEVQMGVRLTAALKEKWESIASERGRDASDLARELMLQYLASYVPT